MSDSPNELEQFDEWLDDESPVAALVIREWLEPVEGKGAVIFPPTYAKPPEWSRDKEWLGYNIDHADHGPAICLIDSVGSQANRMEPVFKKAPYRNLVPQISIRVREQQVSLLDAGHRAADAIVRFSSLGAELDAAFKALRDGDAVPLAKIAPTSLVFGVWDSRGTQVKVPRVVRSVVRGYDVRVLHRSAQYVPALDYVAAGVVDEPSNAREREHLAQLGFSHAPAAWTHGGIQVLGEIRRDAALNLAALRSLAARETAAGSAPSTLTLRRYILGLALVAMTAPTEVNLREGCELVLDPERPAEWQIVRHDGSRTPFSLSHQQALGFARAAASAFGVGEDREADFDPRTAREALGQSKDERRRARRSQARTSEADGT